MSRNVFISYSHDDKKAVEQLIAKLKENEIYFWYDSTEIKAGDSIKEKIEEGIDASSTIIVVFSKNSIKSGWVKYEYNSALHLNSIKKGIKIITLKIDDVEIPIELTGTLYIDISKDRNAGLELLINEIKSAPALNYSNLDWGKITYKDFENLVFELLLKEGFEVSRLPPTRDSGVDFIGASQNRLRKGKRIFVQCKFYKSQKISIDVLRVLHGTLLSERASKIILITNSELTRSSRDFLAHLNADIVVWEQQMLLTKIYSNPDLLEKYFSIKPIQSSKPVKLIDDAFLEMQNLIQELDTCPEGKRDGSNTKTHALKY